MTRTLYRLIVWMHPPAFSRRFGDEMLSIFDEGAGPSAFGLVLDGLLSLGRQWLLRTGCWKIPLAMAGALLQVWGFGLPPGSHQSWTKNHQTITPYMQEVILLALALICTLFIMVMSLTLWTMRFQRQLSEGRKMRHGLAIARLQTRE